MTGTSAGSSRRPSRRSTRRFGPVEVRRVDPGRGWSLEEARDLIRQGYSSEHVERLTGFSSAMLLAVPKSARG